jgi:hypothetical protein
LDIKQKEFTVLMRSIAQRSKLSDDKYGDELAEKMSIDNEAMPNFEDADVPIT